jgi:hypothetical protein
MITPSPTSKIDPHLARGVLLEKTPATATRPAYVTIHIPNTSYELKLVSGVPVEAIAAAPGKRIIGRIRAQARRVDVVKTGGRYVEPVYGRPQRVQGAVVSVDAEHNTITVNAGVPITCELTDRRQRADQFQPGQFVSFDVLEGAGFTPEG